MCPVVAAGQKNGTAHVCSVFCRSGNTCVWRAHSGRGSDTGFTLLEQTDVLTPIVTAMSHTALQKKKKKRRKIIFGSLCWISSDTSF